MRIVDLFTFPDRSEFRTELIDALGDIDLGEATVAEPIDDAAATGLGLPDSYDDDAVREAAAEIRSQLEEVLSEDATVRFEVADGRADTPGGAPNRLA